MYVCPLADGQVSFVLLEEAAAVDAAEVAAEVEVEVDVEVAVEDDTTVVFRAVKGVESSVHLLKNASASTVASNGAPPATEGQ